MRKTLTETLYGGEAYGQYSKVDTYFTFGHCVSSGFGSGSGGSGFGSARGGSSYGSAISGTSSWNASSMTRIIESLRTPELKPDFSESLAERDALRGYLNKQIGASSHFGSAVDNPLLNPIPIPSYMPSNFGSAIGSRGSGFELTLGNIRRDVCDGLIERYDFSGHHGTSPHLNQDLFGAKKDFTIKNLEDTHHIDLGFGKKRY